MFDVGGRDQLDVGQQVASLGQAAESLDHARGRRRCTSCRPVRRRSRPRPPSTAAAISCSDPSAVRGQRGLDGRRTAEQRQPAGLRALDVGRARLGVVEHPVGVDVVGQRAADPRVRRSPSAAGQHVDEARSAVGLRGQRQLVVRPGPAPAVGDGLGGLHRGEAVAVAVGGDQHAEAVRAGHSSRLCWQA